MNNNELNESDMAAEEYAKEELPERPRTESGRGRRLILVSVLLLLLAALAVSRLQQHRIEDSVEPLKEQLVRENSGPGLEVATALTVTRDLLLFGTPKAKIELFLKESEGGGAIQGIEYFYALEDGEWILKESGGCTGEQCAIRGRGAFAEP